MKPKINPAVLSSRNTSLSSKLCLFPRQTLRRAMDVAFKRVGPGDEPPPPPKALAGGARNTAGGTAGGMVYGAVRGWRAADPKYQDVAAIVQKRHRWMRATAEATYGGLRFGSFVAVFSAVQLGSASYRSHPSGRRDMWDTVVAGVVTAGATGLALPGGLAIRAKGFALGIAVGGAMCLPLGFLTTELDRLIPVDTESGKARDAQKIGSNQTTQENRDLTGDAIKSFEAELARTAPRRKSWWRSRKS